MDQRTADILIQANNRFYARQALSFGKTRQNSWPGWSRVVEACNIDASSDGRPLSVLDLACGNKRFEAYLETRFPDMPFAFTTIDNAPFQDFGCLSNPVAHRQLDILDSLMNKPTLGLADPHDICVSFGFMHHVPGQDMRLCVLNSLIEATAQQGYMALSFWRFLDSPSLALQAEACWEPACQSLADQGLDASKLDAGDVFLGWDGKSDVWRYCHSFSTEEIDWLIAQVANETSVADRFRSDGRGKNLNEYVILQKR